MTKRLFLSGLFALVVVVSACANAADTHRTETELLGTNDDGLLPLNQTGEISPQDIRDQTYTLLRNADERVLQAGTIAALRALDIDKYLVDNADVALVTGYTTAGEHSGAPYQYDDDCTDSDDAGLVLEPDDGGGCWLLLAPVDGIYDARWFGVVADDSTDNADALDRIATADVPVIFPIGTTRTSRTWSPARGFGGHGADQTILKATDTWLGGDEMILLNNLHDKRQRFYALKIDGNAQMQDVISTATPTWDGLIPKGAHIWEHVQLFGATQYLIDVRDGTSSSSCPLVGNTFINTDWNANNNSGLLYLGLACDDVTFINARFGIFNGPTQWPVRVHGIDVSFFNTFFSVGSDTGSSSINALFLLTSAGDFRLFQNTFVEFNSGITHSNLDYIFKFTGAAKTSINGLHIEKNSAALPSGSALVRLELGWSAGDIEVRNIVNEVTDIDYVFGIDSSSSQDAGDTAQQEVTFSGIAGFDDLWSVTEGATSTSGYPRAHFVGTLNSRSYNHHWTHDGTNGIMTHLEPFIASNDNLDLIASNADVARFVCPFDATIQQIDTVLNSALATGDATVTVAVAGSGVTGGVVTITQSGSAAGDIDTATPTGASNDNDCDQGELITATVGGSSTSGAGNVMLHLAPR